MIYVVWGGARKLSPVGRDANCELATTSVGNCTTSADGSALLTADVLRTMTAENVRSSHGSLSEFVGCRSAESGLVYQCALSQQSAVPLVRAGSPQKRKPGTEVPGFLSMLDQIRCR